MINRSRPAGHVRPGTLSVTCLSDRIVMPLPSTGSLRDLVVHRGRRPVHHNTRSGGARAVNVKGHGTPRQYFNRAF